MSHEATIWAIRQTGKGLSPAAKLVLWHLADRHNPDLGCFPRQSRLAADCEMARSTVNEHLATLEEKGLIRRERRHNNVTHQRIPTRYFFAFEDAFLASQAADSDLVMHDNDGTEKPCPNSGHGGEAMSGIPQKPCPELPQSHVRLSGHIEPVKEPLREPVVSPQGFEDFWQAYPRLRSKETCIELFRKAVAEGVSPDQIVQAAKRYRTENSGNKPMYLAYSDSWLEAARWKEYQAPTVVARTETVRRAAIIWADQLKGGRYISQSVLSAEVIECMLSNHLVTEAQLRQAGIRI